MKFNPFLAAIAILTAIICIPQSDKVGFAFASSCSGEAISTVSECSGQPTRARKTPARDFLAKQPVRKAVSVLKPKVKSACSGE